MDELEWEREHDKRNRQMLYQRTLSPAKTAIVDDVRRRLVQAGLTYILICEQETGERVFLTNRISSRAAGLIGEAFVRMAQRVTSVSLSQLTRPGRSLRPIRSRKIARRDERTAADVFSR
jgi:hypothetical protein